jgi:hypothetical protein
MPFSCARDSSVLLSGRTAEKRRSVSICRRADIRVESQSVFLPLENQDSLLIPDHLNDPV